jgi:colanic acid/amylovoran biosynthesis protein
MKTPRFVSDFRQRARLRAIDTFLDNYKIPSAEKNDTVALWAAPRLITNVGDRALVQGSIAGIGAEATVLLTRDTGVIGLEPNQEVRLSPALASGSAADFKKAFAQLATEIASCKKFIMIGADIMDGKYSPEGAWRRWRIATWMQKNLGEAAVISMSWNESPHAQALSAIKHSESAGVTIFCRDEISQERLAKENVTTIFAADVSFIRTDKIEPSSEITDWFQSGKQNIIVTVSDWVVNDQEMKRLLIQKLTELDSTKFQILYVPMVTDGSSTDYESCVTLSKATGGKVLSSLPNPGELRWMAARSIFGISARMHCCLLGFAAGMPSIGIEYQGKFKGTFQSFGHLRFAISPAKFSEEFSARFDEILLDHAKLRNELEAQVSDISLLAQKATN